MPGTVNLARKMEGSLPGELVAFVRAAGAIVAYQGQHLYLVGGVVRDLLLDRANLDIDLVVEGDGIAVARQLANAAGTRLTTHARFGTASLRRGKWSVDFVTARSETYRRPGALPTVRSGLLADDLYRRDFTINAMAISLNPASFGNLIDRHSGRQDLERGLIRVLHERSFIDDATRIWRALRYEQRLGFGLEEETLRLLTRDLDMLDTISGDRIRREVERTLSEELPEKVFRRAEALGVLRKLHPDLVADDWLALRFRDARDATLPDVPLASLYTCLLAYRLDGPGTEELVASLRLPGRTAAVVRELAELKKNASRLADSAMRPSRVLAVLGGYSATAVTTLSLATDSATVREHAASYLARLRHVRPALSGNDLAAMGVPAGPEIQRLLTRLRDARVDGEVGDRDAEERLVRTWLGTTA